MTNDTKTQPLWPKYIACYLSLIVIGALGILLMQSMLMAITQVGLALGFYRYAMTVISQFGILILGIFWLIGFLAVEAYLRQGVPSGKLWLRIGKVLGGEVGLLVLAFVLQSLPLT